MSKIEVLSPIADVISRSEEREDKNGNMFVTLRLQGLSEVEKVIGGKTYTVQTRSKEISLNRWKESYLPSKNGAPDAFFNAQVGDTLDIAICRAEVQPYEIVDEKSGEVTIANSYSFPVIGGDNPKTILENAGHKLADNSHSNPSTTVKEGSMAETVGEDFELANS